MFHGLICTSFFALSLLYSLVAYAIPEAYWRHSMTDGHKNFYQGDYIGTLIIDKNAYCIVRFLESVF